MTESFELWSRWKCMEKYLTLQSISILTTIILHILSFVRSPRPFWSIQRRLLSVLRKKFSYFWTKIQHIGWGEGKRSHLVCLHFKRNSNVNEVYPWYLFHQHIQLVRTTYATNPCAVWDVVSCECWSWLDDCFLWSKMFSSNSITSYRVARSLGHIWNNF